MPRDAPATPALILDLPTVEQNIAEMARRMAGLPAELRPHAKIHKSPILGRMQLDAGGDRPHHRDGLGGERDDRGRPPRRC